MILLLNRNTLIMSFNASVKTFNRRTSNGGQVVEIIFDEDGDIADYSFSYPQLNADTRNGERLCYGIFYQRPTGDIRSEFGYKFFLRANEAEDYLIDQQFEESLRSKIVLNSFNSYQLTV